MSAANARIDVHLGHQLYLLLPYQDHWTMSRKLKTFQHHERNQMTDVHTVSSRVNPTVQGDRLGFR